MTQTVARPNIPIKQPDHLFIGGAWVAPARGGLIDVVNPATEEIYMQVGAADEHDVDDAVAAARMAFDHGPWPRLSHRERADYLRKFAVRLGERADDIARVWTSEMGNTYAVASAISGSISAVFNEFADMADTFEFEERIDNPPGGGELALIVREPVGVVGAIVPWNAAINMLAFKVAPALLAGCTVVVKSSPESPGAGLILAEIAEEIGLPPGVLNAITADRGPSERLVSNPGVDKITFTGSLGVGKRIGAIAAERIARVTLELGGKSAGVILDDYDLETAAQSIGTNACLLNGQVCSSLTRIIVTRSRHDQFVEALGATFGSVAVGDPFDASTGMGPIASRRQLDTVTRYVGIGESEGATLAFGGRRPAELDHGFFFQPTVLANVDNNWRVAQEEIFGPVLTVIPADNEDHAVELANDTIFGLNNSVFTNDPDRAYSVARRLRSGTVGQNSFRTDMRIGFGGFKQSGHGREGGADGLRAFLENKTIVMDQAPSHLGK